MIHRSWYEIAARAIFFANIAAMQPGCAPSIGHLIVHLLPRQDRKSTRLNSSHGYISYAVFCLKKKKNNKTRTGKQEGGTHASTQCQRQLTQVFDETRWRPPAHQPTARRNHLISDGHKSKQCVS